MTNQAQALFNHMQENEALSQAVIRAVADTFCPEANQAEVIEFMADTLANRPESIQAENIMKVFVLGYASVIAQA